VNKTNTKGTIGPRRRPLAYYVIMVSPACAQTFITTLHKSGAASRIKLQPHWLQEATAVLVKVQCEVLNRCWGQIDMYVQNNSAWASAILQVKG